MCFLGMGFGRKTPIDVREGREGLYDLWPWYRIDVGVVRKGGEQKDQPR